MCGDGGGGGGGEVCEDALIHDYSQGGSPPPGLAIAGLPTGNGFGGYAGTYYDDSGECPY